MRRPIELIVLLALLGCGERQLGAGDSSTEASGSGGEMSTTTTGESGPDTAATESSTSTSDTDTDTSDTDTSDTDTAGFVCGDGVVDPGEDCDDGNLPDGDLCPSDCLIPVSFCGNAIYACGDKLDNDRDGRIDLYDPDCTAPCDDDEASLATYLPGQNPDCRPDCNWDSNSGAGDDECQSTLMCDPQNPGELFGCEYDPLFQNCLPEHPEMCLATCLPLAANACDCFGCCEIDGVFRYVNGAYTVCTSDDTDACETCTPDLVCLNACEPQTCELCFLQGVDELPDGCIQPSCPVDVEPCVEPYACGEGQMCRTGCCVPIEI